VYDSVPDGPVTCSATAAAVVLVGFDVVVARMVVVVVARVVVVAGPVVPVVTSYVVSVEPPGTVTSLEVPVAGCVPPTMDVEDFLSVHGLARVVAGGCCDVLLAPASVTRPATVVSEACWEAAPHPAQARSPTIVTINSPMPNPLIHPFRRIIHSSICRNLAPPA
jgi:hypothetical protein